MRCRRQTIRATGPWLPIALLLAGIYCCPALCAQEKYFKIKVVDDQTGRGVPLVELRTVNEIVYVTDSRGVVAFHEPGLMGQKVFFHVQSHGYEYPLDGFGYRGKALDVTPGGSARLTIKRRNLAERLYRITGGGIYRDTLLLGEQPPIEHGALNRQVFGSDSVVCERYRGRIYWFWGDTNRPGYPLGNYSATGATSRLPGDGGLAPEVGVNLEYFADEQTGFVRPIAPMPNKGPTWINSLVTLRDEDGQEQLWATYGKMEEPLRIYERGLARFDDAQGRFVHERVFPDSPVFPDGHTFLHQDDGTEYIYFCNPFPVVRVPATADSLSQLEQYEAFTCLADGSTAKDPVVEQDSQGVVRYLWKKRTAPTAQKVQLQLVGSGKLRPREVWFPLRDPDSGKSVIMHNGSVYWNPFRQRWVMIGGQWYGTSLLGEIWYAEADTHLGPWCYAVKVVTHDDYSFYNPKQHPLFDQDQSRRIYFEGTYTRTFSGNKHPTPRYDYNQLMYRLDLEDSRTFLPVPIYRQAEGAKSLFVHGGRHRAESCWDEVAFFALDRSRPGMAAVYEIPAEGGEWCLTTESPDASAASERPPVFYAVAAGETTPPPSVVPLYEFVDTAGKRRIYATENEAPQSDFLRSKTPVCLVWPNPRLEKNSRR